MLFRSHGEPWKVLAIKICLIAALFPLHHYVENKVVHHLVTRKKLKLHTSFFHINRTKSKKEVLPVDERNLKSLNVDTKENI